VQRAFVLLLIAAAAPCQGRWWTGTFDDALEEAARRNVPVVVGFIMDDEEANDRIVSGLYQDPVFHRSLERAIPIVAAMQIHKPKEEKVDGKSVSVCSKFGRVTCGTHRKVEQRVRTTFFPTGKVNAPTHFVILPDETIVATLRDVFAADAMVAAIKTARKKLGGRGLSDKEYRRSVELLADSQKALEGSNYAAAGIALTELEKLANGTPIGKEAEAVRAGLTKAGQKIGARADALASKGEWVEALRIVGEGATAFKGTPLERTLKKVQRRLARTKEGRVAARILKSEDRARPSFQKALVHEDERDFGKATKAYYRVLNLAAGSPLAKKARARLDVLTADRDIAPLVAKTVASQEAQLALKAARALLRQQPVEGRAALERLVARWPKTSAATTARKLLAKRNDIPEDSARGDEVPLIPDDSEARA